MYNAGFPPKRKPYTPDDRMRAVNVLKDFLGRQDYIPGNVLHSLRVLVPELRGREEEGG